MTGKRVPLLAALAVIVVAIVARGWPRRRNDRWSISFKIERDRSDDDTEKPPDAPH